jgi:hypothetical protein
MVVSRDYMLKKTTGPSVPVHFLNTKIVPRIVNSAGGVETLLDRASVYTGLRPGLILTGTTGAICLLLFSTLRGRHD